MQIVNLLTSPPAPKVLRGVILLVRVHHYDYVALGVEHVRFQTKMHILHHEVCLEDEWEWEKTLKITWLSHIIYV